MRLQLVILTIVLLKIQPDNIYSLFLTLAIALAFRFLLVNLPRFVSSNAFNQAEGHSSSLACDDEGWARRAQLHFRDERWIY